MKEGKLNFESIDSVIDCLSGSRCADKAVKTSVCPHHQYTCWIKLLLKSLIPGLAGFTSPFFFYFFFCTWVGEPQRERLKDENISSVNA